MSTDNSHRSREDRRMRKVNLDSNWRVLLVDDNEDNIDIAEAALMFQGIEVRSAADGVEGLKVLEDFTPSLILLDLSMPNMDGWAMFDKLKANHDYADIPVIALTAHVLDADKERIAAKGFTGYIPKPFSVGSLVQDIKQILDEQPSNEDEDDL